jgi:hypothetical protein
MLTTEVAGSYFSPDGTRLFICGTVDGGFSEIEAVEKGCSEEEWCSNTKLVFGKILLWRECGGF